MEINSIPSKDKYHPIQHWATFKTDCNVSYSVRGSQFTWALFPVTPVSHDITSSSSIINIIQGETLIWHQISIKHSRRDIVMTPDLNLTITGNSENLAASNLFLYFWVCDISEFRFTFLAKLLNDVRRFSLCIVSLTKCFITSYTFI